MSEKRKGEAKRRVADLEKAMKLIARMANAGTQMIVSVGDVKHQFRIIRDLAASEISHEQDARRL